MSWPIASLARATASAWWSWPSWWSSPCSNWSAAVAPGAGATGRCCPWREGAGVCNGTREDWARGSRRRLMVDSGSSSRAGTGTVRTSTVSTSTDALYGRLVGPLLGRDDGADAEQLSQLTLTALAQASLRRQWPLVSPVALAGLGAELQRPDPRLEQTLFGCRFCQPGGPGGRLRQERRRRRDLAPIRLWFCRIGHDHLAGPGRVIPGRACSDWRPSGQPSTGWASTTSALRRCCRSLERQQLPGTAGPAAGRAGPEPGQIQGHPPGVGR